MLVPAAPTIHLINDFNALSCAFPVDPELLPSAAGVRTREQGIVEAKSNLDTELHRLREIGATADGAVGDPDPMKAIENPRLTVIRRDHPLNAAAGYLPVARLGPPTSCPSQNRCSADGHHFANQRSRTIPSTEPPAVTPDCGCLVGPTASARGRFGPEACL